MAENSTSAADDSHAHWRSGTMTSSRCVTESVHATHTFEVADFLLLDGMGVGEFVGSTTFIAAGCDWNINVYPDGSNTEDDGQYVSVFLCLREKGATTGAVRVKFILCLLEKDGRVSRLQGPTSTTHTFESKDESWGLHKFIKKSMLRKFFHRNNYSFIVRCHLFVIKESRSEEADEVVDKVVIPEANLHQDIAHMLNDGDSADVTFDVGGKLFPAHRCLLAARSPVFKAEFFGPMKKNLADHIKIDDVEPTIFEALLHFIYTDSVPACCSGADDNVTLQHLLVAADQYGVDGLRNTCEERLCRGIDVVTVGTTLALAEQHHCMQLKDACLEFIASHEMLGTILETDGFKHLVASCPSIMKEILEKVAESRAKSTQV
ncbi:unnamed protein product [Urochloa humidicola]